MTEIIEDKEGYTFQRIHYEEWSMDRPLVQWFVDSGIDEFILINDIETILNLEQSYYYEKDN